VLTTPDRRRLLGGLAEAPSEISADQQDPHRPDLLRPRRRDREPGPVRLGDRRVAPSSVLELVDHMLRQEGRAVGGTRGILASLSAMAEDAIGDDLAGSNPGVRLRSSDPRVQKATRRARIRTMEQMREFAAAGRPEVRRGRRDRKTGGTRAPTRSSRASTRPMTTRRCS
jgi:hypothetical protein